MTKFTQGDKKTCTLKTREASAMRSPWTGGGAKMAEE